MSEIDDLYRYKNQLILLGVTGYTNSGSKSLANILRSEAPFKLPRGNHIYSDEYFSNRKLAIAERYHRLSTREWQKFRVIKVSHLILIISFLMDDNSLDHAFDWASSFKSDEKKRIKELFEKSKLEYSNAQLKLTRKRRDLQQIEEKLFSGKVDLTEVLGFIHQVNSVTSNLDDINKLFETISTIKNELAENLNQTPGTYTRLFQYLGYLIRKGRLGSSPVTLNIGKTKLNTHYHLIPSAIYKVINIYRILDENEIKDGVKGQPTRIIIESLRNHHEIHYLRSRFPNLFMLAVHRDDKDRKRSLKEKYAENADFVEKYERGKVTADEPHKSAFWFTDNERIDAEEFWLSDISKCIQLADIHLYNARQSDTYNDLRAQLCWYLALIMHPGLFPPTDHERVMNIAFQAKLNSGCISRQVGAAVTDGDFRILSIGWNDVPKSQTPCILRSVESCLSCSQTNRDYSKYEKEPIYTESFKQYLANEYYQQEDTKIIDYDPQKKLSPVVTWNEQVPLSYCFKDVQNSKKGDNNQVHTRAVHAEENAMLQVGYSTLPPNSNLFTTASTCELCAKKASELGINSIYYVDPYPGLASTHNLQYTTSPELKQFYGAVGMGFYRLYMPLLPMKEELALLGARPKV